MHNILLRASQPDQSTPAFRRRETLAPAKTFAAHINCLDDHRMLALPSESFDGGAVEPGAMASLIDRPLWLLNDPASRQPAIRPPSVDQAVRVVREGNMAHMHRLARFCDAGLSEERIARYAGKLLDLLVQARAAGYTVVWS